MLPPVLTAGRPDHRVRIVLVAAIGRRGLEFTAARALEKSTSEAIKGTRTPGAVGCSPDLPAYGTHVPFSSLRAVNWQSKTEGFANAAYTETLWLRWRAERRLAALREPFHLDYDAMLAHLTGCGCRYPDPDSVATLPSPLSAS